MYAFIHVYRTQINPRGFSLVEVVVGAALLLLVFSGIIAGFRSTLVLVGHARASSGAIGLATERIEYTRSIPYDTVGTVAGIPSGSIPQNETVALNGMSYERRTLIQYVDAPEDGMGASDTNGITADYKRVKVEITWVVRGSPRSFVLVTNIVPKGMETVAGGGTLVVNVFDSQALPVQNAAVRIVNASTTSPIDVTSYTNAQGVVMFPGAPAGGGYEISASRTGYSLDQTYDTTPSNPNPNPAHIAVVVGNVSTVNLAIDSVSTRTIVTVESPQEEYFEDQFVDASRVSASSSVAIGAGSLVLAGSMGSYASAGAATTTSTIPSGLISWDSVFWTGTLQSGTEARIKVYGVSGSQYTLVPDTELPGNSAGFSFGTTSLSGISATTYEGLALGMSLATSDASTTPLIDKVLLSYTTADPVPNASFALVGGKNIGADGTGQLIPKYSETHQTSTAGSVNLTDLEWDTYALSVDGTSLGYDIAGICAPDSLLVSPNTNATTTVVLVPHTTHSLLVRTLTASLDPIGGATVTVAGSGAPIVGTTSSCGYVYFGGLSSADTYDITISASGYVGDSLADVVVTGATVVPFTLAP